MPTAVPHNTSIADLSAAGLRLRAVEAVTIARALTLRAHRGELPGIPSSTVLRFTADGDVVCEGPVAAGQSVERAGRLLESLLPGFDAPPEFRVPGALRLIVARALGTLDLPPYDTLDTFADAIARFGADDMATLIRGLVRTWRAAVESAIVPVANTASLQVATEPFELTISDVRRARRATGLRLSDIAQRSRIPVSLLRELEWGYFVNWPADKYGRSQLVRYAQAAGLDVEVVMHAVWPVLEEAVRTRTALTSIVDGSIIEEGADDLVGATQLAKVESALPVASPHKRERRPLWLAALAIPALLAIGFIPAVWQRSVANEPQAASPASSPAAPIADRRPAEGRNSAVSNSPQLTPPAAAVPPAEPRPASAPSSEPTSSAPTSPATSASATADVTTVAAAPSKPAIAKASAPLNSAAPAALPEDDVAYSPSFASIGSAMFYHADAGDSSAIMRADTDTNGAVLRVTSIVDDDAKNFHARPSPDGSRIAFDSDREGERAVYVADANGRNVRRMSGQGFAAVPSWSPDGRTLAFVRAEPGRRQVWNIWTVDLDSGDTRRLTNHRMGQPWGAAWFPDGRRIAYSHEDRLIIRALDGRDEKVYTSPKKGQLVRTPAVSPDGRKVMFQVRRDGAWLLDVPSGDMRKVLADPTAEEFTWSPDGRRVAYHSSKAGGWGVWMMAAR